ncbi:UvrD-helicase domain-containing protein [Nocardiopsis sp. NPDC007018]|uniref:HelD family protein n=1 Tax=Nocardiopsis sp. NPDC007018 TaxID=3155721 RepID=UPI0033E1A785
MNQGDRDTVIAQEQAAVDRAYHHFERAKGDLRRIARHPLGASTKDNADLKRQSEERLEALQLDGKPLVFMRADVEERSERETFYVGREGVKDAKGNRLVIKWTAPLAREWRLASPSSPGTVRLRRRLKCEDSKVLSYFDEISEPDQSAAVPADASDTSGTSDTSDPAAPARPAVPSPKKVAALATRRRAREQGETVDPFLLEELNRARKGLMRDIVETIQRDQLELVSDARPGTLVIQGGPGTGKTAVGLHRVTWLLDNDHFKAEQILVVGPHPEFLNYVGQVLPSLGTRGVRAQALGGLWEGQVRAEDGPEQARIKSDARMAAVLERAVRGLIRPEGLAGLLTDGRLVFQDESRQLVVAGEDLEGLVEQARQRPGTHADRRQYFLDSLLDHLIAELAERSGHLGRDGGVRRRLSQSRAVTRLLTAVCPQLSEKRLMRRLLNDPDALAAAAEGVLNEEEQRALNRARSRTEAAEPWTRADLVCLEELRVLLTGDGPVRYRHIVVDEAQNLTPMQVRGLARRCPSGSLTVLGDLAQSTGEHRYEQWSDFVDLLTLRDGWHLHELTVGYRVPYEVMHVSVPAAVAVAPTVRQPIPVRPPEEGDVTVRWTLPDDLLAEVAAQVDRLRETGGRSRSIAVITADDSSLLERVGEQRKESGGAEEGPEVQVLPVSRVNGLEFDHVVLVEPGEITASDANGVGQLYVALTRCTQSLSIVYARPLPDVLVDPERVPGSGAEHGGLVRCTRFRTDGGRCRNSTTTADRWCRQEGCGGYRTRVPLPRSEAPGVLSRPVGTTRGAVPDLPEEGPEAVRVSAAARARFAVRHRASARDAQVELRDMLTHLWTSGTWSRNRDGCWLLDDQGYRLVLSPDVRSVTDYQTVHLERSYAQFLAGVPSRYRLNRPEDSEEGAEADLQEDPSAQELAGAPADPLPQPQKPNTMEQSMSETSESVEDGFLAVIRAAVQREREDRGHEGLRFQLIADLFNQGRTPVWSEFVDVECAGSEGSYLYEVLGAEGHTYARMREGVLRIMEVEYATGTKADRAFLVLPQSPEPPEAATMVSEAFGTEVIWRSGDTWEGTRVDLALGTEG